jgi:hypothetical protein
MTALEIALAVVLPIAGLVIAIALLATQRTREGAIVFVATIVGGVAALLLYL